MKKNDLNKIDEALFSRAVGFSKDEVTEEYSVIDDKLTLVKRKTNTKYYPPELKAIEMLMERHNLEDDKYLNMSLEDLELEKTKLIKLLNEAEKRQNDREKTKNKMQ